MLREIREPLTPDAMGNLETMFALLHSEKSWITDWINNSGGE